MPNDTTAPLAFVDCETTGLHPNRRAWEVAIIRREPDGSETEYVTFVEDVDLSTAELKGLQVGRFYDRHPLYNGEVAHGGLLTTARAARTLNIESLVAYDVERFTRNATIIGAVPSFDTETFSGMLRRHNLIPAWHHRLRCVESLTAGFLGRDVGGLADCAAALSIEHPHAHTALGDARTARAIWDQVMNR